MMSTSGKGLGKSENFADIIFGTSLSENLSCNLCKGLRGGMSLRALKMNQAVIGGAAYGGNLEFNGDRIGFSG